MFARDICYNQGQICASLGIRCSAGEELPVGLQASNREFETKTNEFETKTNEQRYAGFGGDDLNMANSSKSRAKG